jgi:hypothetical protein
MRFAFDDDERTKLAARLGLPADASNDQIGEELGRFFSADAIAANMAVERRRGIVAAVDESDLRREFYDLLPQMDLKEWTWIRSIYVDPAELIVDDDDGSLFRVSYSIKDDVVTFGEPQAVKMEFITASAGGVVARPINEGKPVLAAYDDRETSVKVSLRPAPRQRATSTPAIDEKSVGPFLNDCEATIAAAISADKIPPSRADRYRARWARDPKGTKALLSRLASIPGLNTGDDLAVVVSDEYPREWLGQHDVPVQLPPRGSRRMSTPRVQTEE